MRHKRSEVITIAQKVDTTAQPDMPASAIASGCIDFVLSPENIAQEIVRIAHAADPASFVPDPDNVPAVKARATCKRRKKTKQPEG